MTTIALEKPLTNLQMEILKLYSADLNEKELKEVSDLLSKYLMRRARRLATQIWDEKGYTGETARKWLNKDYGQ